MLVSKVSLIVATFLTGALINRSLGPFNRGIFAEMETWVYLFIVIFGIGMDTAIYHFANRELYGIDDKERLITIILLSFVYSILAAGILAICVVYRPAVFSSTAVNYILLLDAWLITTMLSTNLTVFLQAIGKMKFSALIGMAQALFNVAIIGYGYFFEIIDIRFVVTRLIIIQCASLFILFGMFSKMGLIFGRFSIDLAKGIIKVGIKQYIATIATFIYTKVNQLIVFKYCGESEAGIFAVALNLAFALIFILATFQIVLYPRVIHSSDDYDVTVRSLRIGFYGWGSIVILLILLAKPILLMYGGARFLPSLNSFRILMIAAWFLPLSSLLAPYYVKKGAFGIASFSAALLGIISIGINMLLVPKYASMGAALATAITCLTGFCMVVLFLYYLSRKNPLVIFNPDFRKEIGFIKKIYLRNV
jgi:PST family polysaccharide transporter